MVQRRGRYIPYAITLICIMVSYSNDTKGTSAFYIFGHVNNLTKGTKLLKHFLTDKCSEPALLFNVNIQP